MAGEPSAWRCVVCGYVHQGAEPPEVCPVCGAPADQFEPYQDQSQPAAAPPSMRWRCQICGYVHEGAEAPDACPTCGAGLAYFEPVSDSGGEASDTGPPLRAVVIGGGIAGVAAVEAFRQVSPQSEITLISKEPELPYHRLNLTRYLAGEIRQRDLLFWRHASQCLQSLH